MHDGGLALILESLCIYLTLHQSHLLIIIVVVILRRWCQHRHRLIIFVLRQALGKKLPLYHEQVGIKLVLGHSLAPCNTSLSPSEVGVHYLISITAAFSVGVLSDLGTRVLTLLVSLADVVQQIQRLDRDIGALT